MFKNSHVCNKHKLLCTHKHICDRRNPGRFAPFILVSANTDIIPYLQPSLVISVGQNGNTAIFKNENPRDFREPDVRIIIRPSQFPKIPNNEIPRLQFNETNLNGLTLKYNPTKLPMDKVIELRCRVRTDHNTFEASKAFDVPFQGVIKTYIPYVTKNIFQSSKNIQQNHGNRPGIGRGNISYYGSPIRGMVGAGFGRQMLSQSPPLSNNMDFNVGLFLGPSGSGKTTTAEKLFGKAMKFQWHPNKTVLSHFNSLEEAEEKLDAVDISMAVALAPFKCLSMGEQVWFFF